MLNITAKFRRLPTRFVKVLALSVNSIFVKKKLLNIKPEVTKPEVLQGWIFIDGTINFIIKKIKRDNFYKF